VAAREKGARDGCKAHRTAVKHVTAATAGSLAPAAPQVKKMYRKTALKHHPDKAANACRYCLSPPLCESSGKGGMDGSSADGASCGSVRVSSVCARGWRNLHSWSEGPMGYGGPRRQLQPWRCGACACGSMIQKWS